MSQAHDPVRRRDSVTVPKIWVAVAVSVILHTLALWQWKPDLRRPSDLDAKLDKHGPLIVQIVPERRARPPAPRPRPQRPLVRPTPPPQQAAPAPRKPAPVVPPRPEPRPPVLSVPRPESPPAPPQRAAPPVPAPAPAREPTSADLMAYVEAQRRART